MIVAPTEPPLLKDIATVVSTKPERYGVDVMWLGAKGVRYGVQRKEFPGDFLSSVSDGRLAKELGQMEALDVPILVLEGKAIWMNDGRLDSRWGQEWKKRSHWAFLASVRARGVWVEWTANLEETVEIVQVYQEWSRKVRHTATMRRPGPAKNAWGTQSSRDWQIHLLEGFPDIGPETARRIIDHFGRVPLQWTTDAVGLQAVFGVGKKTAEKLIRAIGDVP